MQARSAVILTGLCVLGVVLLVCFSERAQGETEMTLAGSADVEMGGHVMRISPTFYDGFGFAFLADRKGHQHSYIQKSRK